MPFASGCRATRTLGVDARADGLDGLGQVGARDDDDAVAAKLTEGAQVTFEQALRAELDQELVAQGPESAGNAARKDEDDRLGHRRLVRKLLRAAIGRF